MGKIFYAEKKVSAYNTLGIGRLIYQLPINLCRIFIDEIFGSNVPSELDEETLTTINKFFENNLNVSETSRNPYIHHRLHVHHVNDGAGNLFQPRIVVFRQQFLDQNNIAFWMPKGAARKPICWARSQSASSSI